MQLGAATGGGVKQTPICVQGTVYPVAGLFACTPGSHVRSNREGPVFLQDSPAQQGGDPTYPHWLFCGVQDAAGGQLSSARTLLGTDTTKTANTINRNIFFRAPISPLGEALQTALLGFQ